MITQVVLSLATLAIVAILPLSLAAGPNLTTLALSPLGGALLAAWAAEGELFVGGAFVEWFVALAIAANASCAAYVVLSRRTSAAAGPGISSKARPWARCSQWRRPPRNAEERMPSASSLAVSETARSRRYTRLRHVVRILPSPAPSNLGVQKLELAILVLVSASPLLLLRASYVSHDANAIWIFHALWIVAGHRDYLSSINNSAYAFSNPSYPPLVSAAIATSSIFSRHVSAQAAAATVAVLNACALLVAALGLAGIGVDRRLPGWLLLLFAAGLVIQGFAFDAPYSVGGDADLLWAGCATGAILYGLVLPLRRSHLATAIVCGLVASLTKSEGLACSVVIAVLVAIRCASTARHPSHTRRDPLDTVPERGRLPLPPVAGTAKLAMAVAGITLASGLVWFVGVHALHVGNRFFEGPRSPQSLGFRLEWIGRGLLFYLPLFALAGIVEVVGWLRWRPRRLMLDLGPPWLVWAATGGYLVALVLTYAVGTLGIRGWLNASLQRTMVFPELALFSEMAVWCVIGGAVTAGQLRTRWLPRISGPSSASTWDSGPHSGESLD